MKLYYFRIGRNRFVSFIKLCRGLDVTIMAAWRLEGDLFTKDEIEGYIILETSTTIPETLQLEKLQEKFGNEIKPI